MREIFKLNLSMRFRKYNKPNKEKYDKLIKNLHKLENEAFEITLKRKW